MEIFRPQSETFSQGRRGFTTAEHSRLFSASEAAVNRSRRGKVSWAKDFHALCATQDIAFLNSFNAFNVSSASFF